MGGILAGAAIVFFAFIGFDIVATAAEETKNPKRDLPRGIIGSLVICTVLYVAVSLVVVGMQNYTEAVGRPRRWPTPSAASGCRSSPGVISVGALAGLTSVVHDPDARPVAGAVRDEPRPAAAADAGHASTRKWGTPYKITLITGVVVAVLAGFIPLSTLADLVNIGTLFAFVLVSIGVIDPAPHPPRPAALVPGAAGARPADPLGAGVAST